MTSSTGVRAATVALLIATALSVRAGPSEDAALLEAAVMLDQAAMSRALERGANPNAVGPGPNVISALRTVTYGFLMIKHQMPQGEASRRALDAAKLLVARGAKLGPFDGSVLYFPVSEGDIPLVEFFLDLGASTTSQLDGFTAAELALKHSHRAVYELLVARGGAAVKAETVAQNAFIQAAVDADVSRLQQLLRDGADVNGVDSGGKTALVEALRRPIRKREWAETVSFLLKNGADPNLRAESGFSSLEGIPLHLFIAMNKMPHEGLPGWTDAKRMRDETFRRLIKAGARVSAMDSQRRTPLHIAAEADDLGAAESLIREGARVTARDSKGRTPLGYAESAAMIRLLKRHGAKDE